MARHTTQTRFLVPTLARSVAGFALSLGILLVLACVSCGRKPAQEAGDEFTRLMSTGKNYLDQGQPAKALPLFTQAVTLQPSHPDARLNLANAFLQLNQPDKALAEAQESLNFDRNSAAATYVAGCAQIRLGKFEAALQSLQVSRDLDDKVAAVHFHMGRAHQELGHLEDAVASFQAAIQLEPNHPVAHYALSQALIRAGRQDEGLKELEAHKKVQESRGGGTIADPGVLEKCKHTLARAPMKIELPEAQGIPVTFADVTAQALGADAAKFHAPMAVLDYNRDDRNSLFVSEEKTGFRLLDNQNGKFSPRGDVFPANPDSSYSQMLVGDLNNDRFEDVIVLGDKASHAFRFATNGVARDVTGAAGLKTLVGSSGGLVDLDFTGKLDLLALRPDGSGVRVLRNLGNMYFKDITSTSGVPATMTGARDLAVEDWNNDDLLDVMVAREGQSPLLMLKQRGGVLVPTNLPPGQLDGTVLAVADINNDSRPDILVASASRVQILLGAVNQFRTVTTTQASPKVIKLVDYDNDGWLDLFVLGDGVQCFRNLGDGKFVDVTVALGLDKLGKTRVDGLLAADLDLDGDTDLAISLAPGGLKILRNDGGNKNKQLKLRLIGNRSNASGLGIHIEAASASFRVHRTVISLPVELGIGQHDKLDSVTARWFDLPYNIVDVKPDPKASLPVFEPVLPTGSCPYLYAWDGEKFRFVSDILGSSPLGLRVTDEIFIDADEREHVALGNDTVLKPREGFYELRVTEELREVLYLDDAKLVVADHPVGTEVHTTDKLRPRKPFPAAELWTVGNRHRLLHARTLSGADCTDLLQDVDGRQVSPERLRVPQLRGLAEHHGVEMEFEPLAADKPLVLVLTGWLRFGGGMANVAASHNPELPFPFPQLEYEKTDGTWAPVNVVAGAPSGKTKTILIDLKGKLPDGTRRLRLSAAFEIHWDRIAMMERLPGQSTTISRYAPASAHLHWRGFSEFAKLPDTQPLTPEYDRTFQKAPWVITPTGWCTRYGQVDELVAQEDNALVLLNGGDEVTLKFAAAGIPPVAPGMQRDFFFYSSGWDKDSDFHVELGWKVDPLPWHGMDDQLYGRQERPAFANDGWIRKYNTRWVQQHTFERAAR